MSTLNFEQLSKLLGLLFKPHPWHGVSRGKNFPEVVTVFVEIVPTDTVKYEIDKSSGFIKVDRPQRYSSVCPTMYGLIPQTFCGELVAEICAEKTNRRGIVGDGDPLDICIIAEKPITHGGVIVEAIPVGGFRMIDGNESDDKIISVMKEDPIFGKYTDINQVPVQLIQKLRHYFLTYKEMPGSERSRCEITHTFGKDEAIEIIKRSHLDYANKFKGIDDIFGSLIKKS